MRLRVLCVSLLAAVAAFAQTSRPAEPASRPAAESREERGEALLKAVDDRIYYAGRAGLASLRFSYRPEATGPSAPDFRVQVSWTKGSEPTVAFLDLEKRPLDRATPHPFLDAADPERAGKILADRYVEGAKVLNRLFLGLPYGTAYANWRKRIETRLVNGREETTLVLEPTTTAGVKRVDMSFGPDGLPWKVAQRLARAENGTDVVTVYPVFTTVADRLVLTSFKEDLGSRVDQVVIEYQKVGGFVVPSKIERIVKGSTLGGSKTVFDDVTAEG